MFRSRYFAARYFNSLMFGANGSGPASSGDDWIMRMRRRRGR